MFRSLVPDGILATLNGNTRFLTISAFRALRCATILAAPMVMAGCDGKCTANRAISISHADISSKKLALPEQKVNVTDSGDFWIIEYKMPPGGMGGEVVQNINKNSCSISKTDISS